MTLDQRLAQQIARLHGQMVADGDILPRQQLDRFYDNFRDRFGPAALAQLDGEALLTTMHEHGNHDSLVYWLEFKDDEEFSAAEFGSIAGGTALKFGFYRRAETGVWMTGSPGNQRELSLGDAIELARRNRDQFVKGASTIEEVDFETDENCVRLQEHLKVVAPHVQDTTWGHKYFSLLFPEKLEHYHARSYQDYHLIRLLQIPHPQEGRYVCAGRFVALAQELNIRMDQLWRVLNKRHGHPRTYWRVGTSHSGEPGRRNRWHLMRDGSCVAVGWEGLGDLTDIGYDMESKDRLRDLIAKGFPDKTPQQIGRDREQLFAFVARMAENDIVVAMGGATVLGIGRVTGPYFYEPSSDFANRRPVEWLSLDEWDLPKSEGLRTTVYRLRKHPQNLVEVERRILDTARVPQPPRGKLPPLEGILRRIDSIMERKQQVILYGPPGTGKTYWAMAAARELAARARFGKTFGDLTDSDADELQDSLVRMCCFHPAYGYEDFIEGYRPATKDGAVTFELKDGIFKKLCRDAKLRPGCHYFLVIDEINRGDIPRIFGELLTLLEQDKRGQSLVLPLSGETFEVPPNVYVIGTMNTADRSIALLDVALRRRFGFIECMPDSALLKDAVVEGLPLGPWLDALNRRIREHVGRDARNLQIGHAYLMDRGRPISSLAALVRAVRDDIVPLLQEYCYEDYGNLERILGRKLVDAAAQRIREELFEEPQWQALHEALLSIYQDVAASGQATATDTEAMPEEADEDTEESDEV